MHNFRATLDRTVETTLEQAEPDSEQVQVMGRVQGRSMQSGKSSRKKQCDLPCRWLMSSTHWVRICSRTLLNRKGLGTAAWTCLEQGLSHSHCHFPLILQVTPLIRTLTTPQWTPRKCSVPEVKCLACNNAHLPQQHRSPCYWILFTPFYRWQGHDWRG